MAFIENDVTLGQKVQRFQGEVYEGGCPTMMPDIVNEKAVTFNVKLKNSRMGVRGAPPKNKFGFSSCEMLHFYAF